MFKPLFECKTDNKKVCVVGLGLSGRATVGYLVSNGFRVVALESLSEEEFESKNHGVSNKFREQGVEVFFGISSLKRFTLEDIGFVLLSPGVKPNSELVRGFSPVICMSEFEVSLLASGKKAVLVTGSNGKSTTASLISHILSDASVANILCGNIGTPIFDTFKEYSGRDPLLVVEASSYQLETMKLFVPFIGVFLNLSLNHLERHGTMERYFEAKCEMFERMPEGAHGVIDIDSEWGMKAFERYSNKLKITAITTSRKILSSAFRVTRIKDKVIEIESRDIKFSTSSSLLIGEHNVRNIAVAASVADLLSVPQQIIESSMSSFHGLPHRLERVKGSKFVFNDSKSTTPLSSVSALKAISSVLPDRRIVLMVGGKAKPGGFAELKAEIERTQNLSKIIFFGASGNEMSSEIGFKNHEVFNSLREATQSGVSEIKDSEVLLLSPGCASFDEFNDFEHRGECFKRYVREALSL